MLNLVKFRPKLDLTRLQLAELLPEYYLDEKKKPWSNWTLPSKSSAR
jgi:hypothetical protein